MRIARLGLVLLALLGFSAGLAGCDGSQSEVEKCMEELRDISNETGQPAGSEGAQRAACEATYPGE